MREGWHCIYNPCCGNTHLTSAPARRHAARIKESSGFGDTMLACTLMLWGIKLWGHRFHLRRQFQ
jgi:hypothetical protein